MSLKITLLALFAVLFSTAAFAEKLVIAATCNDMQEQTTLSINFNLSSDSFSQAKVKYDEKIQIINEYAKKQNIKKFELQNTNYNISSNGNNGYQMTGGSSYLMDNAETAFKFAEFLATQKLQVSVSGNAYKNGNCQRNLD